MVVYTEMAIRLNGEVFHTVLIGMAPQFESFFEEKHMQKSLEPFNSAIYNKTLCLIHPNSG